MMVGIIIYVCRSVEEIASLKRKLDKYKSREWMAAGDEVLLEEIKMYKVGINLEFAKPFLLLVCRLN